MRYARIFLALLAVAVSAQADSLDGIAVVVNDSVITYLQVMDSIQDSITTLSRTYAFDRTNFIAHAQQLRRDQLEFLIERKLILDEFNRGEYTTNWLDQAVQSSINQDIKERYSGNRAKLIQSLHSSGLTLEEYTKQQRENVIVMNLAHLHSNPDKIVISPTAVEKYYDDHKDQFQVDDQVKLRTIRITAPSDNPGLNARQIATEVLQKIDAGVPFADMAKVYSTDDFRNDGGDRGWKRKIDLSGPIGDAAFALKAGQHSRQLLEIPDANGTSAYFVIMVDEVRPAHVQPLGEVQRQIEQTLQLQRGNELKDQWIQRLKAKSHIESFATF
jgi:parvulin-like peptidyl-prolyl isomerase